VPAGASVLSTNADEDLPDALAETRVLSPHERDSPFCDRHSDGYAVRSDMGRSDARESPEGFIRQDGRTASHSRSITFRLCSSASLAPSFRWSRSTPATR
jgi:hypothetical protein